MADHRINQPISFRLRVRYLAEFLFVSWFGFAVRLYPRRIALAIGSLWGTLAYFVLRHDRDVAFANLQVVLGNAISQAERRLIVRETFRRLGRVVIGLFWSPRLTDLHLAKLIDGEDFWKVLRDLRDAHKGVVLVTAHYGDWELLCHATAAAGFPMMIVTEPVANPWVEAILNRLRTCNGNRTVPPKYAVLKLFRGLRRGERVGIVCDVNGRRGRGGVWVDFFGLQVFNGVALAELALRTDSAVVFAAARPLKDGRHQVICGKPIEITPTENHQDDVRALTQQVIDQQAALLREDPAPWLWTYKRWKRKPTEDAAGYPFYARYTKVK